MSFVRAALIALTLTASPSAYASGPLFDLAKDCAGISTPTPSLRPPLRYPQDQADVEADGWVDIMMTIAPDGTTRDVTIMDSFGGASFRDSARAWAAKLRYDPPLRDGKPAPLFGARTEAMFLIGRGPKAGSSPAFIDAMMRFKRGEKDALVEAEKLPLWVHDRAFLSLGLALQAMEKEDWPRALYHIGHVTAVETHIEKPLAVRALRFRIEFEAKNGNLRDAACIHKRVQAFGIAPGKNDKSDAAAAAALAQLNDPRPLEVAGMIFAHPARDMPPAWVHPLVRRNFSLVPSSGALDSARLVCAASALERPAREVVRWSVPADAGPCTLFVFGASGATLKLVEEW